MLDKFRDFRGGFSAKTWVAYFLFGAIIVVFALWGVKSDQYGDGTGGVAAVVNDSSITLSEYRNAVENMTQNARVQLDQFPEAQRTAFQQRINTQALEQLIGSEVLFQTANKRGVIASDSEVRDRILDFPVLKENGRFMKDRYQMFLRSYGMTSAQFERQVRKDIVNQKLQELFVGSTTPTTEEMKRGQALASQKINLRFVEFSREDLAKPGFVSDAEVEKFLQTQKEQIEKYYKDNSIEFSDKESVQARHILVKIDEKRPEPAAKKEIERIRQELTPKNFAELAKKYSEDLGSKEKGGDLGSFERGRMVPEFEQAAFSLSAGKISEPVKTAFGYHLILVDKKIGGVDPLTVVQGKIARKLVAREKEGAILAEMKAKLAAGRGAVDQIIGRAGLKWTESGEFDLSSTNVPKLGENAELIRALVKKGKTPGMIPDLVSLPGGRYVLAELISWKEVPSKAENSEALERMMAYRKSSELIDQFVRDAMARATIQRNPRITKSSVN